MGKRRKGERECNRGKARIGEVGKEEGRENLDEMEGRKSAGSKVAPPTHFKKSAVPMVELSGTQVTMRVLVLLMYLWRAWKC